MKNAKKYYVTLLNKIQDLIDQKKVSFPEPKSDDKLNHSIGPQHKKNKNMGIFNNSFSNFI